MILSDSLEEEPPSSRQRPSSIRPRWEPDLEALDSWLQAPEKPLVCLSGPTQAHREALYRIAKASPLDWSSEGFIGALTREVASMRAIGSIIPHDWDLIWNLLTLETLELEGDLRDLVDQGALFSSAFKALWEARFRLDEGADLIGFVSIISRWATSGKLELDERVLLTTLGIHSNVTAAYERLDLLFFLVTLAHQNNLVTPKVLSLDGYLETNPDTNDVLLAIERWTRMGCPLKFMLSCTTPDRLGPLSIPLSNYTWI